MTEEAEYMFRDIDLEPLIDLIKKHDISGWFKNNEGGEALRFFQDCFAQYCGTNYAFATASGSSAIYVALKALGVKRGDTVLVPAYTHVGSVAPIVLAGAKPAFVDVDIHGNVDPDDLRWQWAKAMIVVHMLGMPADIDQIRKKFDGYIIEDASHALGSEYKGRKCGSLGDIGCFSIGGGRTKAIACGEGGMITLNDTDLAEKCKNLRNHGDRVTDVNYPCFNFRMSELNALLGVLQLPKLEQRLDWQIQNAERIIKDLPEYLIPQPTPAQSKTCRYIIGTLYSDSKIGRDEFLRKLHQNNWDGGIPRMNIGTGWSKLISDIQYYRRYPKSPLIMSEKLRDESVWIDWHRYPRTTEEISRMLDHLREVMK